MTIILQNSWRADTSFTAKVERLYRFLEIDEDANLLASSNSHRQKCYLELATS